MDFVNRQVPTYLIYVDLHCILYGYIIKQEMSFHEYVNTTRGKNETPISHEEIIFN